MLTIEQALRRSAVTLGMLAAAAGVAAAQGAPNATNGGDADDKPTPNSSDTTEIPPPPPEPVAVEPAPEPPPPPPTYTSTEPYIEPEDSTLEQYGIGVALGGGVEGFTNSELRDATDDGGGWGVRVVVGSRSPIAFEGSYMGSAQTIDALGLDSDALLMSHGVTGALRVNLMDANLQPFAFGGLAYRHYNIAREDFNTSDIHDADDVFELPIGAGLAYKYEGLLLDARGEFRIATDEDMVPILTADGSDKDAEMHRWGVNVSAGYAF